MPELPSDFGASQMTTASVLEIWPMTGWPGLPGASVQVQKIE